MSREIVISVYLFVFRVIFNLFKLFPQREKTVLITSFGDNAYYIAKELMETYHGQVVILKTPRCRTDFKEFDNAKVLSFESMNLLHTVQSIYHLATSKVVFVDNYFGCLSVMNFKENVVCVQLWHAAGAIKKFGLLDPSIANRSEKSKKRFKEVYQRFHYVVVGSEKMANIFKESFGIDSENILRTGIPRTDFFYDKETNDPLIKRLINLYPVINEKKVILYAPTFRDGELKSPDINLDIERLHKELSDDYVLFLRLHPAMQVTVKNDFEDFVYDVSSYEDVNHLLLVTDILISDYSSIPFEYALLERPMIFHAYDLEPYSFSRGFWEDYKSNVPGPVTKTTEEIIRTILEDDFSIEKIRNYARQWNQFSYGHSSKNVISAIYEKENDIGKVKESLRV